MPFVYGLNREKITLRASSDDVAVAFTGARPQAAARKAFSEVRSAAKAGPSRLANRISGNVVLLRDTGGARAPFASVASVVSKASAKRAERTYPVYVDDDGLRVVSTGEIVVRFRRGRSVARRRALLAGLDLAPVGKPEYGTDRMLVAPISVPSGSRAIDLANALSEAHDLVDYAAPNFLTECRKFARPNDPLFGDQWHLDNDGDDGAREGEDVRALEAWQVTPGGSRKIVIAIIDDGVDTRHPDLKANIWRNPERSAPDKHGRDFTDDADPYNPNPRVFNPPFDDTDTNDIHGTCCAGVAAAVGNNKKGVVGIAYRSRILPVKIFAGATLAAHSRIADSIRYAGLHADVLSCSWGISPSPDVESAIDDVVKTGRRGKGCLVFCATGNEYHSRVAFPARHPSALAVGASNDRGKRSKYSNWGKATAFVAPSSDEDRGRRSITTTDVSARNRGYAPGSAYADDFGGTSSATPLAAGIAALLLSVNSKLTWQKAAGILKSTADKIDATGGKYERGYSLRYGYGRLNAHRAVLAAESA
jgi:hypothetical protein